MNVFEKPQELSDEERAKNGLPTKDQEKIKEMFEQLKQEYGKVSFEEFIDHTAQYLKLFEKIAGMPSI